MAEEKQRKTCRMCGAKEAVIKKYKLNICRRCFREKAEQMGFKKFS